jgi:adenylate cyclase
MTDTRRLAAILAADVVGYSRLIGGDEGSTLQAFKAIRAELLDPTIAAHNGRIVKRRETGCSSSSAVWWMRCVARPRCKRAMGERNASGASGLDRPRMLNATLKIETLTVRLLPSPKGSMLSR